MCGNPERYVEAGKQWYQLQSCPAWLKIQMKQESNKIFSKDLAMLYSNPPLENAKKEEKIPSPILSPIPIIKFRI